MNNNLSIKIGSLKLNNPVSVASGTFGYAEEFGDFLDLKKLGAIVTKTITLKARRGNKPPRTCEVPAGMLNSIGLENPGLELFIQEKLKKISKINVPIIVSIASENDPEEFCILAERLSRLKEVAALELNISCPNVKHAAKKYKLIAQDPKATFDVVKSVRKITKKPIITKLSPNVTDITEIALAAQEAGSDALCLVNTLSGMAIDVEKREPKISMIVAGLSGPGIRPVALRMVWEVFQKVKVPIIGSGGIIDTESALEFILAGASVVSIGTANFINPQTSIEILDGIKKYMQRHKVKNFNDLIGVINK